MSQYTLYNLSTGEFEPFNLEFKDHQLPNQRSAYHELGFGIVAGKFDCRVQKFDLGTETVIDRIPAKPNATDTWDETRKVWVSVEEVTNDIKTKRDALLRETDWVSLRAADQGQPVSNAWKTYRQALRDLTAQPGFPNSVVWPSKPQG